MMTLPRTQTSLLDVCAKEGGKETAPFPWTLAVHHQSLAFRARPCHAKNEAPEEEVDDDCKPISMREFYSQRTYIFPGCSGCFFSVPCTVAWFSVFSVA